MAADSQRRAQWILVKNCKLQIAMLRLTEVEPVKIFL